MTQLDLKKLLLGTSVLAGFAAMSVAAPAYAQTADDEPIAVETVDEVLDDEEGDEVVVTGSRLKKSTFTSIAPVQVITTDESNQEGLFSPVEILQSNPISAGQQIDSTFNGFVLGNGPGSETINLRGLGASRTLVLLNGRRVAPAGVEGAPQNPSLNLLPQTMIDRNELVLDGASAVYGSDAVAGVANVILRNDYDGLEIDISGDRPEGNSAGSDYTLGARYGVNGDRGFIGGAVEYRYTDPYTSGQREFFPGCQTRREVTESGEIRTLDQTYNVEAAAAGLGISQTDCVVSGLSQSILLRDPATNGLSSTFGVVYYQPEIGNAFGPFSESTLFGTSVDANGDGIRDVNFVDFTTNANQVDFAQLNAEQKQSSLFLNGEYTFEGEMNITPYFEVFSSSVNVKNRSQQFPTAPIVPANNPFNPCNFNAGGADCNQAYNELLRTPNYQTAFLSYLNSNQNPFGTENCFNLPDDLCTPQFFGLDRRPEGQLFNVQSRVGIVGDRSEYDVEIAQTRIVGGTRGDLPGLNFGSLNGWEFDASVNHTFSKGLSKRPGLLEQNLNFALGINPNDPTDEDTGALNLLNGPCDATGINVSAEVSDGCVPVNFFAPSLFSSPSGGDFATQAERDYLFGVREFDTRYTQTLIDIIAQGNIFELPGGEASLLVGAQFRRDEIDSQPNRVASEGLILNFFRDAGAAGTRDVNEVFFEASLPLGNGELGLRELNFDIAGRLTDDEFYGANGTYSLKGGWRPVESLLLKGTVGTSFRAPNMRELFLRAQSGFNNGFGDPCSTPASAIRETIVMPGQPPILEYDPTLETRNQTILDNCSAVDLDGDGVGGDIDPTDFLVGNGVYSVEVFQSGIQTQSPDLVERFGELDPETSNSFTAGFSFDQPWSDKFDLELGATYSNFEIENSIVEAGSSFSVSQCYSRGANLSNPFCELFSRNANTGRVEDVTSIFVNRDSETAEFVDYNFRFSMDNVAIADRSFDFFARGQYNNFIDRTFTVSLDEDNKFSDQLVGDFGFADWTGQTTIGATYDRWTVALSNRFISSVESEEEDLDGIRSRFVDDFTYLGETATEDRDFNGIGNGTTCLGPDEGDTLCRPVFFADSYNTTNLSVTYDGDDWNLLVGVRNLLNDKPPLVDGREVFQIQNIPIGNGYNLLEREYFMRIRKTFR